MAKVSLRNYNREIEAMTDRSQLDEAIAHCLHILTIFPKHLETYRLLGKAYLEYKRYKDAVDIFSRVLVVEPNDFVANVGMSIIRDEEDKLDDAIWHMERAFEVQSANPAIQGELQRLYGRREGVQPPRIRMTRGALAHMYMQGELYPQAISEVKSVLSDDAGRTDMQVLMARAYFKSGQKNEAADTASAVLRRYPYCLDANRILVEILGSERSDNSQLYRQRVIELDPYAAQVSGSIFEANEVGDAAVTLEHFEWDGKPIGSQPEWDGPKALSLEGGRSSQSPQGAQAQPDWLKSGFTDVPPAPQPTPKVVPPLPAAAPTFDFPASVPAVSEPESAQPTAEADIPEFLRAAGWGESTGTFDESKSMFADEPVTPAAASEALPIEQGDMPDWLKAMAPPQVTESTQSAQPAEEEILPDWINKIGTGALSTSAAAAAPSDEFDWLNPSEEVSTPASDDQPDWINQLGQPTASQAEATDQPDWMKQLDQPAASQAEVSDQLDWMKQLDQPASSQPESLDEQDWMKQLNQPVSQEPVASDQPDWLGGFGSTSDSAPASATLEDQSDWMKQFGDQAEESVPASSVPAGDEFDFLNELTDIPSQPISPAPVAVENLGASKQELDDSFAWLENLGENEDASENLLTKPQERLEEVSEWDKQAMGLDVSKELPVSQAPVQQPVAPVADDELGKSQPEIDDSLAWLENLAAKQGATEGLLIKPEDRKDVEPDWVQKIKGTSQPVAEPTPTPTPAANVEDLGKSQSEIDDSLAWFESLAAKQGATEGLLLKPEDRKDVEPDWVQKVKGTSQPTAEPTPAPAPAANVEELGKSQAEIDDSLAWFESLAAKQGATEGLLIKPEDRKDVEPDWVQKIKSSSQPAAEPTPAPAANVEDLGKSQSEIDDSLAWFESLAAKQGATEGLLIKPEDRKDVEPDWVQKIKSSSQPAAEPIPTPAPAANVEELGKSQSEIDDSLAWFESLAAKQGATEGLLIKPEDRKDVEPDWVKQVKSAPAAEPTPASTPAANVEELGKSQSEIDDSLAWFESLAAKQGATEGLLIKPEDRKDVEPDWVKQVKSAPQTPETPVQPESPESYEQQPVDDTAAWLSSLDEEEAKPEPVSVNDETAMWLQTLNEPEPVQQIAPTDDMPAWLQGIGEEKESVAESVVPAAPREAVDESDWMSAIEEPVAASEPVAADEDVPSWLKGIDEESSIISASLPQDDLPAWMRDETGEIVAEPTKIEPTRPTDWHPIEEKQPEPPAPVVQEQPKPVEPVQEKPKLVKKAASKPTEVKPATPSAPYREPVTIRGTGMLTMPVDPILGSARSELSRSNIPGALETYAKLIKKGRFLDEVIFDLREALYRYPVEVSIWQSLGDAYMRANRLQDALDAYTKAEELLR